MGIAPSLPSAHLTPRLPRSGFFCVPRWPNEAAKGELLCWGWWDPRAGEVGGLWLQHPFAAPCWDGDPGRWLLLKEEEGVLLGRVASPHAIKPGISLGSISSRSGSAGGEGKPQAVGLGCHLLLRVKALGEGQGLRSPTPWMFPCINSLFLPKTSCLSHCCLSLQAGV